MNLNKIGIILGIFVSLLAIGSLIFSAGKVWNKLEIVSQNQQDLKTEIKGLSEVVRTLDKETIVIKLDTGFLEHRIKELEDGD